MATALQSGDFAKAMSVLKAAHKAEPSNPAYLRQLATIAWKSDDLPECISATEKLLATGQGNWHDFELLRQALLQDDKADVAVASALAFVPKLPANPHKLQALAKDMLQNSLHNEVVKLLRALPPGQLTGQSLLQSYALALSETGEIEEAETVARQLVAQHRENPAFKALVRKFATHKKSAKPRPKPEAKRSVLKLEEAQALAVRIHAMMQQGHGERALSEMLTVLESHGDDERVLMLAAEVALHCKDTEKAERFLLRAAEVSPQKPKPRIMLADLYRAQNKLPDAQLWYEAVIELLPNNTYYRKQRLDILTQRAGDAKPVGETEITLRPMPMSRFQKRGGVGAFFQDIRIYSNIIWNLALRDMQTRQARSPIGIAMELVEPVAHIFVLWVIFTFLIYRGRPPLGEHWIFFYATGIVPYLMFAHLSARGARGFLPFRSLLEVPVIKPIAVLLGAAVSELLIASTVAIIIFSAFHALGLYHGVGNFYALAAAFLMIWLLSVAAMFLNAGIASFFPSWSNIWQPIQRIFYFISGIIFVAQIIPRPMRDYIVWNPLLVGIEWFRNGFFTQYDPPWLDRAFLLLAVGCLMVFGVALQVIGSRRALD